MPLQGFDPFLDIVALGQAFRDGTMRPRDTLEHCLNRIADQNNSLNAMALVLPERARAAAHRAERELTAGADRGPLHGVPIAVKDLIDIAGETTGYGTAPVMHQRASRSARLVENLEAAGAVILGKNVLLEFAYGSVNPVVGQTNNPWDIKRTSGGSSSGGAASVASGMCFGAVGTDTGGSIRIPAAYCGIVGLKPSFGLVDLDRVFPLSWSLDHAGPMARSSTDALILLDGMTGICGDTTPAPLSGLRIGVLLDQSAHPAIRPDVSAAFTDACDKLAGAGVQLTDVRLPALNGFAETLLNILLPEAAHIHKDRIAKHADSYGPGTRHLIKAGPSIDATSYLAAQEAKRNLTTAYAALIADYDALIAPSVAMVAPDEDPPVGGDDGDIEMLCSGMGNLVGAPSVSIFAGIGEAGMPVGLTLNGPVGGDRRLMRIAAGFETLLPPQSPPELP